MMWYTLTDGYWMKLSEVTFGISLLSPDQKLRSKEAENRDLLRRTLYLLDMLLTLQLI